MKFFNRKTIILLFLSFIVQILAQNGVSTIQINKPAKNKFSFLKLFLTIDSNKYYKLSNLWQGTNKCLDLNTQNGQKLLTLKAEALSDSQLWKLKLFNTSTIRITNKALGETFSMDIVKDGSNNKIQMAQTGTSNSQAWNFKLQVDSNLFFRLTNSGQGQGKSLDVNYDQNNNFQLVLASSSTASGQFWKFLDETGKDIKIQWKNSSPMILLKDMIKEEMYGFKVLTNKYYSKNDNVKLAKQRLNTELKQITTILEAKRVQKLKVVPIEIILRQLPKEIAHFHPSKQWLIDNGYSPQFVNSIEISNAQRYYDDLKGLNINTMLHQLSHAYRSIYLGSQLAKLTAGYNKAKNSGKYDNVDYINGFKMRHYGMTNVQQFFAQMSETFIYKNDFYPWNKTQLKKYDPDTYKLMQQLLKV